MSSFTSIIESFASAVEVAGVFVIALGFVLSAIAALRTWRGTPGDIYATVRSTLGRSILLGLEVLVAGDIIKTVALQLTLGNVVVLGLLVVIRTFLAWSLEVEIEGRWPWQRDARPGGVAETRGQSLDS